MIRMTFVTFDLQKGIINALGAIIKNLMLQISLG